jgi:hypothetical protein
MLLRFGVKGIMDAVVEVNVGGGRESGGQLCTWALELKTGKVKFLVVMVVTNSAPTAVLLWMALLTVVLQEYSIAHRSQAILYSLMMSDLQVPLPLPLFLNHPMLHCATVLSKSAARTTAVRFTNKLYSCCLL